MHRILLCELRRTFDILTSWDEDPRDASEYFVYCAARAGALLALVASHPHLVEMLEQAVAARDADGC